MDALVRDCSWSHLLLITEFQKPILDKLLSPVLKSQRDENTSCKGTL